MSEPTFLYLQIAQQKSICCCNQDVAVGLSWREETELRKALYASMQKQKQHREKDEMSPVNNNGTGTFLLSTACITIPVLNVIENIILE